MQMKTYEEAIKEASHYYFTNLSDKAHVVSDTLKRKNVRVWKDFEMHSETELIAITLFTSKIYGVDPVKVRADMEECLWRRQTCDLNRRTLCAITFPHFSYAYPQCFI